MKRTLVSSLPAKVAALFLTVLLVLSTLLLVACPMAAVGFAGIGGTTAAAREAVAESVLHRYASQIAQELVWELPMDEYEDMPFTYEAADDSGKVFGTYTGGDYLAKSTATYMYEYYPYLNSDVSVLRQMSVTLYADPDLAGDG